MLLTNQSSCQDIWQHFIAHTLFILVASKSNAHLHVLSCIVTWLSAQSVSAPRVHRSPLTRLKSCETSLFLSWRSASAPPDYSSLHFIAVWAWKLLNEDLLQKYIPSVVWNIFVGNRRFFGEQVSSRKLLRRIFSNELLPISTCYFV